MIIRSVVVLPAPLGPMTPYSAPAGTTRSRSWTAVVDPNVFRMPFKRSAASMSASLTPRANAARLTTRAIQPTLKIVSLLPFVQWAEASSLGTAIRSSPWAFAVIESVHLLALAVIGGAVLIVDLRLLGWGLQRQAVAGVARDAQPWFVGSLIVMLGTGFLLFMSEPTKCYYSTPFAVKMICLVLSILFAFTIRRKVTNADESRVNPIWLKLVALVSLGLWFGVGAGGRWIGFSG